MKLKNFLIICLVFSFFMAAAVIPAVAQDFDAEVFMITDFNEDVNLWPSTKDVDVTTDLADFSGRAVVSSTSRDVHVSVEGYGRRINSGDIQIEYYGDGPTSDPDEPLIITQIEPQSLRSRTDTGCTFTIPVLKNETDLTWIRIIIFDDEGNDPVYSWAKVDLLTGLATGTFTPDAADWNNAAYDSLMLCNSVNLTLTSSEAVYLWWRESDGMAITESEILATVSDFDLEIDSSLDPNFIISYTNARFEEFNEIEVKHANMSSYYDDSNQLNLLTAYVEGATPKYLLLMPQGKGLTASDVATNANVYYEGNAVDIVGTPSEDAGYFEIELDAADFIESGSELQENWTNNNSQVAVQMVVNNDLSDSGNDNLYVAGPDDGVGPRMLSASLAYDNAKQLTLTFSEDIDASLIDGDGVDDDLEISASFTWVVDATASGNKIVVTTNKSIDADDPSNPVYINIVDPNAENIRDNDGNAAYRLFADLKITVERVVESVAVTAVDQTAGTTDIKLEFDKSMKGPDVLDLDAYAVELVDGLVEDPNGYADVLNVTYTDTNMIATVTVDGVIESTAADDLPGIMIVKDIIGGDIPATIREEDLNVMLTADDQVGPYLVSAAFDFNGEVGKDPIDMVLDEKVTLTLVFSEDVENANEEISYPSLGVGASGFAWDISSLKKADVSSSVNNTVTLTLDDDADDNVLPYSSPAFAEIPKIYIAIPTDVEDENGNPATDAAYEVVIDDVTDVWASGAEIMDVGGNDVIIIEFGKNIIIDTSDLLDAKLVEVDGDPNLVANLAKTASNEVTITLTDDDARGTDWTPIVSFDLDEDNAIEDLTAAVDVDENDLTTPFSIVPDDLFAPVLINIDPNGPNAPYIPAIERNEDCDSTGCIYNIVVLMEFSEPMNPDIWAKPEEAGDFFENADYDIISFVTDGPYACGGNKIAVEIDSNNVDLASELLEIQIDITSSDRFEDLNENLCTDSTVYTMKTGLPVYEGIWDPPSHVNVVPSPSYMMLQGDVIDPNGDPMTGGQFVYAVSRDKLFTVQDDPNKANFGEVTYGIDPVDDCYGATVVQDDGTYHIMVYGENDDTGTPGFVNGDPIILMIAETTTSSPEIATTACLSNSANSVPFIGKQTPTIKPLDLNLQNREVIKLSPGWNLISTSVAGVYVDADRAAASGLDAAFYSEYIFDPDMDPADIAEYDLSTIGNSRDISALLFTIASPDLNNYVVCPLSLYNQADSLADTTNYTPVFGPGLGYYIFIDEANVQAGSVWEIVLFGETIPGPNYMVKVNTNQELVGHWGNMLYRTSDGDPSRIHKTLLPSTYDDVDVYVDDISIGAGSSSSADEFALTVTDDAGDVVEATTVSTFFNNKDLLGPSVWFGTEQYYGLGSYSLVLPGGASWVEIDAENGPFFIEYMVEPEDN